MSANDPHRPFATIDCRTANKLLVDITSPINSDFMDFVTPKDSFGALEIAKAAPANADTHPNALSNTLYVDDTSQTDSKQLVYLIRKMPKTIEPYVTLYCYVSVPTVECVKIIDQYIQKITSL